MAPLPELESLHIVSRNSRGHAPKEKPHPQNVLPTVRELLEEKRRSAANTSTEEGAAAFQSAVPSWHVGVSQPTVPTDSCRYGSPVEFSPTDTVYPFSTTALYPACEYSCHSASLYPDHAADIMSAADTHPNVPSIPYYPPNSPPQPLATPQPMATPQPIAASMLEQARRTIQNMEVTNLLHRDDDGDTVLHIYAAKGMREFVLAAAEHLRQLHSLELREHKGKTPLLVAVTANQAEVVSDLIELGADVNATDFKGQSALHLAPDPVPCPCPPSPSRPLSPIPQRVPDPSPSPGLSPVPVAHRRPPSSSPFPSDDGAILQTAVPLNVEARNFEGLTAMHCAVKSHNQTMRKMAEAQDQMQCVSPQLQGAAQDRLQCIILLLNMGASIFTQDIKNSVSVLHLSVQDGNLALVEFFTNIRTPRLPEFLNMKAHGNTALHMAAGLHGDRNQLEIIQLLLARGADPSIRNLENEQAIHLLQPSPIREQIKQMLKRGRPTPRFGSS
ncbi:NF-kappa-B inhibitor delta-like [Stegostoma tigrinum]|uniref:NF-kappa-B inhibitor delta-like n=1 Tax=Stegostoma tigrinum TaxID=3053191 RepID=UPI00287099E5|nr:NF-kappa-B inhibitor delta-like [Stegostoma tigrinum]